MSINCAYDRCRKPFQPARSDATYCSATCRALSSRQRRQHPAPTAPPAPPTAHLAEPPAPPTAPPAPPTALPAQAAPAHRPATPPSASPVSAAPRRDAPALSDAKPAPDRPPERPHRYEAEVRPAPAEVRPAHASVDPYALRAAIQAELTPVMERLRDMKDANQNLHSRVNEIERRINSLRAVSPRELEQVKEMAEDAQRQCSSHAERVSILEKMVIEVAKLV